MSTAARLVRESLAWRSRLRYGGADVAIVFGDSSADGRGERIAAGRAVGRRVVAAGRVFGGDRSDGFSTLPAVCPTAGWELRAADSGEFLQLSASLHRSNARLFAANSKNRGKKSLARTGPSADNRTVMTTYLYYFWFSFTDGRRRAGGRA